MRLLWSMDNLHSTKAYETPTALFQMVLVQAEVNYVDKKESKLRVSEENDIWKIVYKDDCQSRNVATQ